MANYPMSNKSNFDSDRMHNLKEKERQCREMKQIVHNAKVSRHLEDKEEKK